VTALPVPQVKSVMTVNGPLVRVGAAFNRATRGTGDDVAKAKRAEFTTDLDRDTRVTTTTPRLPLHSGRLRDAGRTRPSVTTTYLACSLATLPGGVGVTATLGSL